MERYEDLHVKYGRILEKYSWLPKLGIWLFLIFWAAQGGVAAKNFWDKGKDWREMRAQEDWRLLEKAQKEMGEFGYKLCEEARKKERYSSKDYYADLKKMRLENKRIYSRDLDELHRISKILLEMSQYTDQRRMILAESEKVRMEISEAQKDYGRWLKEADVYKNKDDETFIAYSDGNKMKPMGMTEMFAVLFGFMAALFKWFMTTYIRGLLIVPFLFIARMIERGSHIGLMVKDKKFSLAVIFWPGLLFQYPFHLVRELRVEAELRRMGKAFRQFGSAEINLVRKIASSADYKAWLAAYRLSGKGRLQRSLSLAIIVTLAVHALSPLMIRMDHCVSRDGPAVNIATENQDDGSQVKNFDSHDDFSDQWCIPELIVEPPLPVWGWGKWLADRVSRNDLCRKIGHIPLHSSQVIVEVIPIT